MIWVLQCPIWFTALKRKWGVTNSNFNQDTCINCLGYIKVVQNSRTRPIPRRKKKTGQQRWRLNYIFRECSCALPLSFSLLPQILPHTQHVCVSERGPFLWQPRRERDAHYGETSKTSRGALSERQKGTHFGSVGLTIVVYNSRTQLRRTLWLIVDWILKNVWHNYYFTKIQR